MCKQTCRNFLTGVAVLAILAGSAFAANHHELNGTWQLVPARSTFNGEPVIESGTVSINDREGNITVSRNFYFDAPNQSTSTSFSTDSRHNASIKQPGFRSKSQWEGNVLKVTTTRDGSTAIERYSLRDADVMMLQIDRPGHQPETLYFERQ